MCGRYYIDEETAMELEKIVIDLEKKLNPMQFTGDIVPTAMAPVITDYEKEASLKLLSWGFQRYDKKGVLINARAETLSQKRTFRDCLHERRCIVPATGFYEWDKSRNKFTFTPTTRSLMLMAGIYDEEGKFVIITTKANESMEPVHDRMPLILTKELGKTWLTDRGETDNILKQTPMQLKRSTENEQLRLEFF